MDYDIVDAIVKHTKENPKTSTPKRLKRKLTSIIKDNKHLHRNTCIHQPKQFLSNFLRKTLIFLRKSLLSYVYILVQNKCFFLYKKKLNSFRVLGGPTAFCPQPPSAKLLRLRTRRIAAISRECLMSHSFATIMRSSGRVGYVYIYRR